ncbi:MAG: 2-C-methyl-D-erythritol 2,4-cyclodiphosphate synthase [Ignavibacteriales bacterium]|nr:2-C-methyl-D-erythritol 2,4-cyclodiphosphate synthase [Ignavibacteriales bacterium]
MSAQFRIGFGCDIHKFSRDRILVLGGIVIPSEFGLEGHSDADVLLHAICDAMLGALALGDIGKHFPNTSDEFKDIDSKILLKHTYELINQNGYELGNIDSTLVMEKPKILPYVQRMKEEIANVLSADINQISIKATTSEKLGFIGREEGAAAYAVVLLTKKEN